MKIMFITKTTQEVKIPSRSSNQSRLLFYEKGLKVATVIAYIICALYLNHFVLLIYFYLTFFRIKNVKVLEFHFTVFV